MITRHFNSLSICRFMPDILLFSHLLYVISYEHTSITKTCRRRTDPPVVLKGKSHFWTFIIHLNTVLQFSRNLRLRFGFGSGTYYCIYLYKYIYIVFYLLPYLFFSWSLSEKSWLMEKMSVFVEGMQEGKWSGCICDCIFLSFCSLLCGDGGFNTSAFKQCRINQ